MPTTREPTSNAPAADARTSDPDARPRRMLRVVLRVNAANSAVFGALMAAVPDTVDDVLDTGRPGWIRLVGLGLVGFAAVVAWLSTASAKLLQRLTPHVVIGDVGWVVGSVVTVLLGWYSASGNVAVATMALAVDVFATLQWLAWRRLTC